MARQQLLEQKLEIINELLGYGSLEEVTKTLDTKKEPEWGESSNERMNFEEFGRWCESKGDGWRRPTAIELFNAYLDGVDGFKEDYYWSSTTYPLSTNSAFYVNFSDGTLRNLDKFSIIYGRCVR